MPTEPAKSIADAKLKTERAYQHISNLNTELARFLESRPYALSIERDFQADKLRFKCGMTRSIPPIVMLLIGDAVHNLKAPLDYVWSGLHRAVDPSKSKVYFPIGNTRNDVISRIAEPGVKRAFPDIERIIADEIKPYHDGGGDGRFRTINHLDRWDKHNLLIPAIGVTNTGAIRIDIGGRGNGVVFGNEIYSDVPAAFLGINMRGAPPDIEITIEQDTEPSAEIVFGKGQPAEHRPVVPTLTNLAQAVSDTVNLFAQEFG